MWWHASSSWSRHAKGFNRQSLDFDRMQEVETKRWLGSHGRRRWQNRRCMEDLDFRIFKVSTTLSLLSLAWELSTIRHVCSARSSKENTVGIHCPPSNPQVRGTSWMERLLIGRDLILRNTGWAVGNGETIRNNPRLSYNEQIRLIGPAQANQQSLTVVILLKLDWSNWDREAIQCFIPHEEERILIVKPIIT